MRRGVRLIIGEDEAFEGDALEVEGTATYGCNEAGRAVVAFFVLVEPEADVFEGAITKERIVEKKRDDGGKEERKTYRPKRASWFLNQRVTTVNEEGTLQPCCSKTRRSCDCERSPDVIWT